MAFKILIVEDESIIAEDMKQSLTDLGYNVPAIAHSGLEAIRCVREFEPDIVLMDIVMPGEMDGIEAAGEIRTQFNVPVIFVTSYADDTLVRRAKTTQPFGYIFKPFVQRELHTNIEMALYKHKAENDLRNKQQQLEQTLAELKEAQEKIIQQERLAAVGQLAAGIAHDFNNIMASIILNADMVLRSNSLDERNRGRVSSIQQQGRYAADLTQKMLDFCGMSVLKKQVIDMDSFVDSLSKQLISSLPANIEIRITSDDDDLVARVDPERFQQAFQNIVTNSMDAMPKGGEISIQLDAVRLNPAGKQKNMIRLTVSDTGEGIPADVLPHIFEPFFTTRLPLRSGLGLAQAHGIIKQHGGSIEVESQIGKGTKLSIFIPALDRSDISSTALNGANIVQGQGQTILVVVSDRSLRDALISSLEMLNYNVLGADSTAKALDLMEGNSKSIKLILSDLSVPSFQGIEVLHTINEFGDDKRVIFLAGWNFIEEISNLKLGNTVFGLEKPIDLEDLARGVAKALR